MEFLGEAFDIKVVDVNPAYTSQECPECHYVHRKNRNGDRFKCLYCGNKGHADHFAAMNIKRRMDDDEIKLKMKKTIVKEILEKRYKEFLESKTLVTV